MKKVVSIILSVTMLLSITAGLNITAFADELPASGKCGENATFTFDKDTGTLVISGQGDVTGVKRFVMESVGEVVYYDFSDFSGYSEIKSVIINEGITRILPGEDMWCPSFSYNENLASISLPDSLLEIGGQEGYFSFDDTAYYNDKTHWDSNIFYADTFLINAQDAVGDVTVKSDTKGIGNSAFYMNNKITSIVLPEGLKSLGFYSIRECDNLKSINFPSTLEYSAEWSLAWNPSLTDVDLSKTKLTEIPTGMFWACENLKSIHVPASVTSFGDNAIGSCYLSDIYYGGTKSEWSKVKISNQNDGYDTYALSTYIAKKAVNIHCSDGTIEAENPDAVKDDESEYSIKLSKHSYVYNGKTRKPGVTVTLNDGTVLKEGEDYTVSYAKGRKYVGKYKVKVTFKGEYTGSETVYFTIKPAGTSISGVSRLKKGFKVRWKKKTTQVTGYQIQYSRKKNFASAKTVTVKGAKKTSTSVRKLAKKKYYYVRIRTYKSVNGKKICSSWSKVKKVKTK